MSTPETPSPAESRAAETLSEEEFLEALLATRECFPLNGGTVGARGETETVGVANFHTQMRDLLDLQRLAELEVEAASQATIDLPLEITDDFKYSFDPEDTSFRVGRGAILHIGDQPVPVRLVTIDFIAGGQHMSSYWLYRDERDEPGYKHR